MQRDVRRTIGPSPHRIAREPRTALIVGGGPAGTAAALALAQRGLPSVILERSTYSGVRVGESLSPEAQGLLAELGVWERFLSDGHQPSLANLGAWGEPRLASREHLFSPYGRGWHLDRGRFDAMLASAARDAGVPVLTGALLESVAHTDGAWRVGVRWRELRWELAAEWLIDASGRPASLARRLGGRRVPVDRQVAMTAFLAPEAGASRLDLVVLVEAEEAGWWYSAPLPDGRAVAAFLTDAGLPGHAALRDPAVWWQRLHETFHTRRRLDRRTPPREVIVRAAGPAITQIPEVENFLLAGDAAVAFDPLSGMGVCAALRGGLEAAAALAAERGGIPGARRKYETEVRQRFEDHLASRAEHYALESRWSRAPFWSARRSSPAIRPAFWLDPECVLKREEDAEARWALDRLEGDHPDAGLRRLCEVCPGPTPAHRVVAAFLHNRSADASRALHALQMLVDHGVLSFHFAGEKRNFPPSAFTS